MAETLALRRIRDTASLLWPAARGALCLLMESALATPRRLYVGAGGAALAAGIIISAGGLLLQTEPHPARLLGPATHSLLPPPAHTAAPAGTVELSSRLSPTAISDYTGPTSAAVRPTAGDSRALQAAAPDITSSIEPATRDNQHKSSASEIVRSSAALAPDQIGAFLRDKSHDESSLVRTAQIALAKLGYAVKSTGTEDVATRRALRHFERAHGLAPTTEISSKLLKQLAAAAGGS